MSTANNPLDALVDAIAEAVAAKLAARMGDPATLKRLYTVDEAATYLGKTRDAVYQAIHRGRLPVVKDGRAVRITREDLERFTEMGRTA